MKHILFTLAASFFAFVFFGCGNTFLNQLETCTEDCFIFTGRALDAVTGNPIESQDVDLNCLRGNNIFALEKVIMKSQTNIDGFFDLSVSDSIYLDCSSHEFIFTNGGSILDGYERHEINVNISTPNLEVDQVNDLGDISLYHFTEGTVEVRTSVNTVLSSLYLETNIIENDSIVTFEVPRVGEGFGEVNINNIRSFDVAFFSNHMNRITLSYRTESGENVSIGQDVQVERGNAPTITFEI